MQNTTLDSVARYTCDPGYTLQGNNMRTCQANSSWTGEDPVCTGSHSRKQVVFWICTYCWISAPIIVYLFVSLAVDDVCMCVSRRVCVDWVAGKREWLFSRQAYMYSHSSHTIIFAVVSCTSLSDPVDGVVTVETTVFNSQANYTCNPGFFLVGDSNRTCQADATWTGEQPDCEKLIINTGIILLLVIDCLPVNWLCVYMFHSNTGNGARGMCVSLLFILVAMLAVKMLL